MKKKQYILLALIIYLWSCTQDSIDYDALLDEQLITAIENYSPDGSYQYYVLPSSNDFERIPQDPKNRLSPEKVELGKFLFYETGFSTEALKASGLNTYSCSTCHLPDQAFKPGRMQGIADGGQGFGQSGESRHMNDEYEEHELDIQAARPLSLINVAFVKNTFWNGQFGSGASNIGTEHLWSRREDTELNHLGFEAIETQNFEGLRVHRISVSQELVEAFGYKDLFDRSFPEYDVSERYSNTTAALAISAFIRTITASKGAFQDWLRGNTNAMTAKEKEGALLFFGKAKCSSCHYEKNLGSDEFHVLGVKDMDQHPEALNKNEDARRNLGRGGFTLREEDMYKFRVPGLYNVADSPFYFHGSSKKSLEEVIRYKAKALRENGRVSQLRMSEKLHKLELSDSEIDKLVLFLEKSLNDPDMERFGLHEVRSGMCTPNNDPISREELGCQ